MYKHGGISFQWTGHDGFKIIAEGKTVYIDPYRLGSRHHKKSDADLILVSHNHFDHLSVEDLKHVVKHDNSTVIVSAKEGVEQLQKANLGAEVKGVAPGDRLEVKGVKIEAVPAYNTNKNFHPKADRKVGYVLTLDGLRIYHTGDTDEIPEMSSVKPDIALVPVSGTYVMTAEEAARAVNEKIKPAKLAIPMHYGAIVGSKDDAAKFKDLVEVCSVQVLDQE
ncbi:MAG: MBL fold metallo-hydrolase [Nitrososphaera sp.]|jgi:L-ascorbate metabolism protein UlaG (beta-lactamase superfamily)